MYIPERYYPVQCEVCYKIFPSIAQYNFIIDADGFDYTAKGVEEGLCNRITCPYCHCEFTFENPLLIFSWQFKTYAVSYLDDIIFDAACFSNALKISGSTDINLRKTDFASEAAEKINIARFNLSDAKIEKFKTVIFPQYIHMDNTLENIVFDKIENGNLFFSHRHFTDTVISKFTVPFFEYDNFNFDIPNIPKGKWIKIDKFWILNNTED